MNVEYFNADQVQSALNWPMVVAAVKEALKAVASKDDNNMPSAYAVQPVRSMVPLDNLRVLLTMPAYVSQYHLPSSLPSKLEETLACKLVTSFSANEQRPNPLPNIQAHILLFNTITGQLQSILEATQITAWRTAAASIVATKYLFFSNRVSNQSFPLTVAIIGCGRQGQSHALGICATFKVSQVNLWNRTRSKAIQLSETLKANNSQENKNINWVRVCETPQEALEAATVICIATFSPNALIDYNMLKKNKGPIHINAVGAGQVHYGEVAQDIYDKALVYVDSIESSKVELKGLKANIQGTIGEVIHKYEQNQFASCPLTDNQPPRITIFQSMGMAAEDATVAQAVYNALQNSKTSTKK